MTASRVGLVAAVCAVVAWAAKATVIGVAGGLDRSPAEGPLFLVGLVCALVGAGALGAALTAGRSSGVRALAAVAVVGALLLIPLTVGGVVTLVQPADPSWVWGEVNLWVSALALLAAVLLSRSRRRIVSRRRSAPRR